jgi:polyisoprenoid-binding protein YceI
MTNSETKPNLIEWTIDPVHTTVGFSVRHLMLYNVRGVFKTVSGVIRHDPDQPGATEIEVAIPVASIDTREPQRDAHLRSPDFFDAERHPQLLFRATHTEVAPGGLAVTGDLTMRGVTRQIVLAVTDLASGQNDLQGNPRMGATATGKLRRSEFGISFNKLLDAGGLAIGDEVTLSLDVSLVRAVR